MLRKILALILTLALLIPAFAEVDITASTDAQLHNISLALSCISPIVLEPGATFSFNDAVGPRTIDAGFLPALNGRGAEVPGGGVAQVASALYLALLPYDNIVFNELAFYGDRYNQAYVPSGNEAILVDYNKDTDFQFTNLYPGQLIIELALTDDAIDCEVILSDAAPAMAFAAHAEPTRRALSSTIHCGDDPAILQNIALAADSIYDLTLATGDVFSFNDVVGPREERYGYCLAVNGRGAEVVGGGVAQVASALWLIVQGSPDFAIVEKSTYGSRYNQSYVESSADAILVDYNAGTDFVFKYTGDAPITLYPVLEDGVLTLTAN